MPISALRMRKTAADPRPRDAARRALLPTPSRSRPRHARVRIARGPLARRSVVHDLRLRVRRHAGVARRGLLRLPPRADRPDQLHRQGLRPDRLLAFNGLKEEISFSGVPSHSFASGDLAIRPAGGATVLFRRTGGSRRTTTSRRPSGSPVTCWAGSRRGRTCWSSTRRATRSRRRTSRSTHGPPRRSSSGRASRSSRSSALVDLVISGGGTMAREAALHGPAGLQHLPEPPRGCRPASQPNGTPHAHPQTRRVPPHPPPAGEVTRRRSTRRTSSAS